MMLDVAVNKQLTGHEGNSITLLLPSLRSIRAAYMRKESRPTCDRPRYNESFHTGSKPTQEGSDCFDEVLVGLNNRAALGTNQRESIQGATRLQSLLVIMGLKGERPTSPAKDITQSSIKWCTCRDG
jgi:hypothetical protein